MQPDVVIVSGARTPIGRFGGALRESTAVSLGAVAVRAAVERAGIDPGEVDEVVVGHARQAGNGPNPGRLVALEAGLPAEAPAHTVQQACLSSLKAVILAFQSIVLGDAETAVAAGTEHMSSIPYLAPDVRWGSRMGDRRLVDAMYRDGFIDPTCNRHMGSLAEAWAERYGISRTEQDEFALASQQKAQAAKAAGIVERMLAPVEVPDGRSGSARRVAEDEHPRPDTTLEQLSRLPPAFAEGGTVTAGNACGITDGAAALVMMSARRAEALRLKPLAVVRSYAVAALRPEDYGLAPAPSARRAMERAGIGAGDLDVVEINEAFAVQVLAVCRELDLNPADVNPWGGAIALGHPVGMSGARIVLYAALALRERGGRHGLATICGNGGHGGTVIVERP
jgi:acetyl-CoA C-acetyltransferase